MKNSKLDDAAYHSLLIDRFLDAEDGSETARSGGAGAYRLL